MAPSEAVQINSNAVILSTFNKGIDLRWLRHSERTNTALLIILEPSFEGEVIEIIGDILDELTPLRIIYSIGWLHTIGLP
ncbi:hypothetical protein D3C78_1145550 [compost metagenome]